LEQSHHDYPRINYCRIEDCPDRLLASGLLPRPRTNWGDSPCSPSAVSQPNSRASESWRRTLAAMTGRSWGDWLRHIQVILAEPRQTSPARADPSSPSSRSYRPRRLPSNPSDCKDHELLDLLEALSVSESLAIAKTDGGFHPRTARPPHGRPARGLGGIRSRGTHPSAPGLGRTSIIAILRGCRGDQLVTVSRRYPEKTPSLLPDTPREGRIAMWCRRRRFRQGP
jgi:hypothetical protein